MEQSVKSTVIINVDTIYIKKREDKEGENHEEN